MGLMTKKTHIILIRDGWGENPSHDENALFSSHPPNTIKMMEKYPHVLIDASGDAVGLPPGTIGNSEVGHMTIGSGRINDQMLMRINKSIKNGEFFKIPAFLDAINHCKEKNSTLHLICLLQTESVHAHLDHLLALLDLCKTQEFSRVAVHAIADGRDSDVRNSEKHIKTLRQKFQDIGFGSIATVSGRYYTMDRDKRWERTKLAYDCLIKGESPEVGDILTSVEESHKNNQTDEFLKPRKIKGYAGVQNDDAIIFVNFRTDRPRQITKAIVEMEFEGWERKPLPVFYVAMADYYKPMNAKVAFGERIIANCLGEVLSKAGLTQLRISETEKYAHVTFFFNGQVEKPYEGEDRVLIPSPKVATYDLQPEMSAYLVTERVLAEIESGKYDVIVWNIVNGDMVGHTAVWDACIKACLVVDECVQKVVDKVLEKNGVALVFADHGNIEDQSERFRTSHTTHPVPFIVVSKEEALLKCKLKTGKGLQDVAPTLLKLLGVEKPKEMTGESIIE